MQLELNPKYVLAKSRKKLEICKTENNNQT